MQWARARIPPPSSIMPSFSYGAYTSAPTGPTLSISPTSATYNSLPIVITATCSQGSDSCAVDAPLGTHLATGTGSATYTISNPIAVGTYTYYANDITSAQSQSGVLTINKATPVPTCTYRGQPVVAGNTITTIVTSGIIACNGNTYNGIVTTSHLSYNSTGVATGNTITYNAVWDNMANAANFIVPLSANYVANSLAFTLTYSPYQLTSSAAPSGTGYETQGQSFTYTLNITKATSATLNLWYNGNLVNSTTLPNTYGTPQAFNVKYWLPLTATNNIQNSFLANAVITGAPTSPIYTSAIGTLTQNELWNYVPVVQVQNSNIILGQNQTVYINVTDLQGIGAATFSGAVKIGTRTDNLQTIVANKYYDTIYSFLPSSGALTMPGKFGSVNIPVNVAIQFTYGSNTVWRNATASFVSTNETVTTCNAVYPTTAINWAFYTLPSATQFTSANVYLTGAYSISKNSYSGPVEIRGQDAGLPVPGTANQFTYSTCEFPAWSAGQSSFFVSSPAGFTYNATTYPQATYYLNKQQVNNSAISIKAYMANQVNPILYSFAVENITTQSYIAATVQILQQIPGTNSSALINTVQTPIAGTAQAYLAFGVNYQFGIYNAYGKLLELTPYSTTQTCSSQPCLQVFYIGNNTVQTTQSQLSNLKMPPCTQTDSNVTHIRYNTTIACTWSTIQGTSYNMTLLIRKQFGATPSCTKSLAGMSGTLTCQVGNTNNTQYYWTVAAYIQGQQVVLQQGNFGTRGNGYGNTGIFMAFVFVIACGFALLSRNFIAGIVMADIGMVAMNFIGLFTLPLPIIGALQVVTALLIWVCTR